MQQPMQLVLRLSLKITLFIVYTVNNSQAPVCFESPPRDVESSAGVCGGKRGERKTPNGRKRGQRGLKRDRSEDDVSSRGAREKVPSASPGAAMSWGSNELRL